MSCTKERLMNKTVYIDSPNIKYFDFINKNYPWNWGDYNKFVWKHCEDPYKNEKQFYVIKNENKICSLGVGNVYPFSYKNESIKVLMMMDFVTSSEYQKKGLINQIANYIVKNVDSDVAIGFASKRLYENIYKDKLVLQKYYLHQFNESISKIDCGIVDDYTLISKRLNSNTSAFQIKRDERYLDYINKNPQYEKVIYVTNDELLVGIGLNHNVARIIELSEYNIESCIQAIQMALNFASEILVDLPCDTILYNSKLLKETYVVLNEINTTIYKEGDESIWIPVIERK